MTETRFEKALERFGTVMAAAYMYAGELDHIERCFKARDEVIAAHRAAITPTRQLENIEAGIRLTGDEQAEWDADKAKIAALEKRLAELTAPGEIGVLLRCFEDDVYAHGYAQCRYPVQLKSRDRIHSLWNEREEYVRKLEDAVSNLGDYAFDTSPSSRMDSTRLAQRVAASSWRELHAEIRKRRGGRNG